MIPEVSASVVECDQIRVTTLTWFKRVGVVLLLVTLLALIVVAPQAVSSQSHPARTYAQWVVNTAIDENDGSCSGDCSLRDAIALAANGDAITFAGDYIIYLNSWLGIAKTLTIDGSGHIIRVSGDSGGNGSPNVRVFFIDTSGVVTLTHLSIISGTASGWGGGIVNRGMLTIQNSTISGNSASQDGGGIDNWGTLTIQNSTFSGNSSSSAVGMGGGIYNEGMLTIQNSTFSGNSATFGGGIYNWDTLNLFNTLIANSPSGGDCINEVGSGTINVNDHNLIEGNGETCGLINGAGGSLIGVDPLLGSLANNGGDTQTFALLPGSPALNAGNNTTCLSTDQRGIVRPQGTACDIGAYEAPVALTLVKSVTPMLNTPYHGVVTYTILLSNNDSLTNTNVLLTDSLPAAVIFDAWLQQPVGAVAAGNAITWTGEIIPGGAATFRFTATHIGAPREWVTNTAHFSGTAQAGSASAGFQVTAYVITPTASAGGSITPSTVQVVNGGGSRDFNITPNMHYHTANVMIDGASIGAVSAYTFTNVTADHTIAAAFAIDTFVITPTAGAGGSITPGTPQTVPYSGTQMFTITPDVGYHVVGVYVDGTSVSIASVYTFTNVTANHTLSAMFALDAYTLTVNTAGSGSVARVPDQSTYLYGDVITLTATPNLGWYFGQWSGDASGSLLQTTLTMNANKVVTATFAVNTFIITPTAGTGGGITPSTPQTVPYSGTQAFAITPNVGYHILDVSVDSVSVGAVSMYTFTNVTTNHTLTATFAPDGSCVSIIGLSLTQAPSTPLVGQMVTFTGTVATGTSPITYTWSWGDGTANSTGALVTHIFPLTAERQTYTVTLMAANACPSSATIQQPMTVVPRALYLPIVLH
jgi:CSLREA domain-containing protein